MLTDIQPAVAGGPLLLALLREHLPMTHRPLSRGEPLFDAGDPFSCLSMVTAGSFKTLGMGHGGRSRVAMLHLPGDWLGFEGIADGTHAWRTEALDNAQVASIVYADVLHATLTHPQLLRQLHAQMGHEMERHRLERVNLRGLATETRVARFLLRWIEHCEVQRCDGPLIAHLPLSRAEMGELLGMTVESASRAMSRLVRDGVIDFSVGCHRDIHVRSLAALKALAYPEHPAAPLPLAASLAAVSCLRT
jgi:CRP/FNR family transcriptional regulator, anaerobic regulatory protein